MSWGEPAVAAALGRRSIHSVHGAKHARKYGPPPDGRLLAGIAGHSLSFDHFGPPSLEETAAGLTTHGEAPALRWKIQKQAQSPRPQLQYGLTLPEARIRFSRKLTLDRVNPVIYCEEEAVNLGVMTGRFRGTSM